MSRSPSKPVAHKRKFLVTGGAGFIGSHLVDALVRRGPVTILDALTPPVHQGARPPAYLSSEADLVIADVEDERSWDRVLDETRVIVHLAAFQDYRPSYSMYYRTNAVGTALLFEKIVQRKTRVDRVVVVSSQAVVGEGIRSCALHSRVQGRPRSLDRLKAGAWDVLCPLCGRPTTPLPNPEDAPADPVSIYGLSKLAAEQAARRLSEFAQVPTVILRPSIVIGARQSPNNLYSGACRSFAAAMLGGRQCIVHEDGRQLRDFVAVEDVVSALITLIEHPDPPPIANVGGERGVSVNELLRVVASELGITPRVVMNATFRLGDSRDAISDTSRLRDLGWQPEVPLKQAVASYLRWVTESASRDNSASGSAIPAFEA